jgi:phosphatidylglycerophosphatase A
VNALVAPPTPLDKPKRLTALSWEDRIAHVLATWFGCGHVPLAPGTAGSLGALPLYLLLRTEGIAGVAVGALVVTAVGLWASHRTCLRLGQKDPQIICIDEAAGVLLTWTVSPSGWRGIVAGLVAFRIADQLKPWPANVAEKSFPGGWGVMLDDVFAAFWAMAAVLCLRGVGLFN